MVAVLRSTGTRSRTVGGMARNGVSCLKVVVCCVFSLQVVINIPCNMKFFSIDLLLYPSKV